MMIGGRAGTQGSTEYEVTIGLEVHVQIATESKIFCSCSTEFGATPNSQTCPVCLGMPGTLPVLNKKAVEAIIKTGLALNCEIAPYSRFDRKNYFYPDLPKGYQITQYDLPICQHGYLELDSASEITGVASEIELEQTDLPITEGGNFQGLASLHSSRRNLPVRVQRIHLEEDAGKLIHGSGQDITRSDAALIDFNRAGIPLMEIVTEPDLTSPAQARAFLTSLKSILEYLGVSDCNMEEGSLRADANISIRPVGATELGIKTELKNMNSFRAIERALEYEIQRQAEILQQGGQVQPETRTWDEKDHQTVLMRSKGGALDYRYFPETDLLPIQVDQRWLEEIRATIGELPQEKRRRFRQEYGLSEYDARLLTQDRELAEFFEAGAKHHSDAKAVANWIMGDFICLMKEAGVTCDQVKMTGAQLGEMLQLVREGTISTKIAKTVFDEMFKTGQDPRQIVAEQGLVQISDTDQLQAVVEVVFQANPQALADYQAGKEQALKFLVGQVMKETRGKANPALINKLVDEKLHR